MDMSLPMNEKDNSMLPILQQKRVLTQAVEDLTYLKNNPPKPNQACGISKHRKD